MKINYYGISGCLFEIKNIIDGILSEIDDDRIFVWYSQSISGSDLAANLNYSFYDGTPVFARPGNFRLAVAGAPEAVWIQMFELNLNREKSSGRDNHSFRLTAQIEPIQFIPFNDLNKYKLIDSIVKNNNAYFMNKILDK